MNCTRCGCPAEWHKPGCIGTKVVTTADSPQGRQEKQCDCTGLVTPKPRGRLRGTGKPESADKGARKDGQDMSSTQIEAAEGVNQEKCRCGHGKAWHEDGRACEAVTIGASAAEDRRCGCSRFVAAKRTRPRQ